MCRIILLLEREGERERSPYTVIGSDTCVLTEKLLVNWQLLGGGLMQICFERQKNSCNLENKGTVCVCVTTFVHLTSYK